MPQTSQPEQSHSATGAHYPVRVSLSGRRCHRQPLAYPALRPLFEKSLRLEADMLASDILLFGHPEDLTEAVPGLELRGRQIVYLSEEPFWDTVGPIPPFIRRQVLDTETGPVPITCLTHHTSAIFGFNRIPYFLLTESFFAERYAKMFGANHRMTKTDWQTHFTAAPLKAAFMAENRLSPKLDVHFDAHDVRGLSTWRTDLAIRYRPGPVLRAGKGWPAGSQDRVALTDWHLDKLRKLDRQCVFLSALENTHQKTYVSEKIFDAFAIGAVPLYYAAPGHAVHRIVPEGSWLNLYGLSPAEAVEAIDGFAFDDMFFDRYREAQETLADLFCNPENIEHERERLRRTLLAELQSLQNDQPRS